MCCCCCCCVRWCVQIKVVQGTTLHFLPYGMKEQPILQGFTVLRVNGSEPTLKVYRCFLLQRVPISLPTTRKHVSFLFKDVAATTILFFCFRCEDAAVVSSETTTTVAAKRNAKKKSLVRSVQDGALQPPCKAPCSFVKLGGTGPAGPALVSKTATDASDLIIDQQFAHSVDPDGTS